MSSSGLCDLPPVPSAGCCGTQSAAPTVPIAIENSPGLAAIDYRIGTFTSFRRKMLDRVASVTLPDGTPNPFAGWHEGGNGDYQTLFIELWAYLADVLTFYQERIANEAYISTATQRDSLTQLAQLISYRPAPGAGASGVAAFTVAKDAGVTLPAGYRIGSQPQPGRPAAVFETSAALTARGEHSEIAPSAVAPTNQFAQISTLGALFGSLGDLTPDLVDEVYGPAAPTYVKTLPVRFGQSSAASRLTALSVGEAPLSFAVAPGAALAAPVRRLPPAASGLGRPATLGVRYVPFRDLTTRTVVLQGVNNRLALGDYVLVVENENADGEKATPYQLSSATIDKAENTTTLTWQEPSGTVYDASSGPVALYALRVKAAAFGNSAPNWYTLSPTLTNSDKTHGNDSPPPRYQENWDDPTAAKAYVPAGNLLALDAVYDGVSATPDNPAWVVLVSGDRYTKLPFRFIGAQPVTLTDYALSTKVTQLTLDLFNQIPELSFGIRDALVLAGGEALTLQNNLPIPDPLQGDTLVLQGLFRNLQDGQTVIIKGNLFPQPDDGSAPAAAAELRLLDGPPLLDETNNLTTVRFRQPLANAYQRASTTMLANVVAFTQGETVKSEVLGSGDGSALQSYVLQKDPLTYLPASDPTGISPLMSQLIVSVNGVRWNERPTLAGSAPDAKDFTTTRNESGQTTILFGDGVNGARPPSGRDNIRARYRRGLGTSGNVPAGGIEQLIDNLAGVQTVSNPQPTIGGTDPEPGDQIRLNAPMSLRTFNRAVSPGDYAALARTFPGIARASAAWTTRDSNGKPLTQPYMRLTVAAIDENPILQTSAAGQLRNFLDARRDPNVPLRIQDFTPVYVDVALTVDLEDGYPRQATFARVQAALAPGVTLDGTAGYFAFENLDFGESLHLSGVYAAVMQVAGVRDANITTFRRMDLDAAAPSTVRTDILVGPTEIAAIGNDPENPQRGLLVLGQGSGGFVDS